MTRPALHFPGSTKPADLTVDVKRRGQGSVPRITKGAGRIWGWVVAPLVIWTTIFVALGQVYAVFWGAR